MFMNMDFWMFLAAHYKPPNLCHTTTYIVEEAGSVYSDYNVTL